MPVSDILHLARMTNQQLADLALQSDRDARRARGAMDHEAARRHERERDRLLGAMKNG